VLSSMLYRDAVREVWKVEGEKAIDGLNGLLTNDLSGPEPGSVIPCLALTPRGRPLVDLRVWKRIPQAGPLLLDLSTAGSEPLREHLGRYLPPRFARIVPLEEAGILRILGPRASSVLTEVLGGGFDPPPTDRFSELEIDSEHVLVAGRPETEGGGWEILALHGADRVQSALDAAVQASGGDSISDESWETIRIERGIPRYGVDYGLENLPQETGLTGRTVSFEKGCYTGQEVVARIHYRGRVNRRLVGLSGDGDAPIQSGAELFDGDRQVGGVSSVADSPKFGAIALGMVRREVEPGARLSTSAGGDLTIEVRTLPFT
jgi:folate-binding protein YgfZ